MNNSCSSNLGEIQETGSHDITIWNPGLEPQWMIDEIIKNEEIIKKLQELVDHKFFKHYTADYLRNYIDDILNTTHHSKGVSHE